MEWGVMVRKALVCVAAMSAFAGAAHADELSDLKKQSEQLQQQNQKLMTRIDQLEQREQKLETQQAVAQPAAPATPGPSFPADDGSLTWHGVTLYGGIDLGAAYQSHGTPLNGDYGPGLEYLVSKNLNKGQFSLAPNALSYSNLGIKGTEELVPGLSAVFNFQTTFVPTSGQLSNGPQSLADNNGVALAKQTSNGDSSRAGQPFNGAAYVGLSSPTWGTITFGRQNSLSLDGVIAYDPNGASNAFSLIGYAGGTAGDGDTQDARLDNSVKYLVNLGPVRVGGLVQIGGTDNATDRSAYEADIGTDFMGLSVDAIYSQVYDAIAASALAAPTAAQTGELAGTVSDNTAYTLLARYSYNQAKIYAGWERIQFDNAQNPLPAGSQDLGGFILATTNNAAFNENKILNIYWTGVKYAFTSDFDLTGAWYHETQNSSATATIDGKKGQLNGCTNTSNALCSGTEDAFSVVADYRFTKRFDVYAGAMFSEVEGGLESGFLHGQTVDPTVGARFRF
jgi:predicted porin